MVKLALVKIPILPLGGYNPIKCINEGVIGAICEVTENLSILCVQCRYSFVASVLAFLYSAYQLFKGVCNIAHRGFLISDMASDYSSFILDQVMHELSKNCMFRFRPNSHFAHVGFGHV